MHCMNLIPSGLESFALFFLWFQNFNFRFLFFKADVTWKIKYWRRYDCNRMLSSCFVFIFIFISAYSVFFFLLLLPSLLHFIFSLFSFFFSLSSIFFYFFYLLFFFFLSFTFSSTSSSSLSFFHFNLQFSQISPPGILKYNGYIISNINILKDILYIRYTILNIDNGSDGNTSHYGDYGTTVYSVVTCFKGITPKIGRTPPPQISRKK